MFLFEYCYCLLSPGVVVLMCPGSEYKQGKAPRTRHMFCIWLASIILSYNSLTSFFTRQFLAVEDGRPQVSHPRQGPPRCQQTVLIILC